MLHFSCVLLVFCTICFCYVNTIPTPSIGYYSQKVDHFSISATRYSSLYLFSDVFWNKATGPIFFYTGNEGPIEAFWNNTGLMFDLAPIYGALIIFAEHRYYGKSLPFGNQSFTSDNLRYLTIEQALADFAVLLSHLKQNVFKCPHNPVISFGGSYGGMLTAYMRFKYPNLIQGGIVGSAPIYWIANVSSSTYPVTFFDDVTQDFANINPKCVQITKSAFATVQTLFNNGSHGRQKLRSAFNLCNPLQNATDLRQLYGWARNAFVLLAMLDYPYPTNFMAPLPGWPVKVACQNMLKSSDNLTALKKAVEVVYQGSSCHDIYKEYIYCADPTGCGTGPDAAPWDYQACTQMYLPLGSNNKTDMFPELAFTPNELSAYCFKKYKVVPKDNWLSINFWGDKISTATNLVFSNGDLDPWHRGGVLSSVTESLVAVRIKDGAHHLDLRGANPLDPDSVRTARKIEQSYITKWISQHWSNLNIEELSMFSIQSAGNQL